MSDHKSEAIVVVVFLLLIVGHRVQRLRELDGLLQSGVEAVVRLVPKTSKGNPGCPRGLPLHVDKIRVERFDWVLLVSLVESYIPLVKAVFCRHGVVVYGTAHVVVGAVVVVVVAYIERLHQLCVVILKCCCSLIACEIFQVELPEGRTASEGVGTCPSRCRGSSSSSACTHRAPQSARHWSEPLTAPAKRGIRLVGLFVC